MAEPLDDTTELVEDGPLDRDRHPAPTVATARRFVPGYLRRILDASPVAGAVLAGAVAVIDGVWNVAGTLLAAAQSPRHAGAFLLDLWGYHFRIGRRAGERDEDYRARLLAPQLYVTPTNVRALIVDVVTTREPHAPVLVLEPTTDGMFCAPVRTDETPWTCFVQPPRATGSRYLYAYDETRPDAPGAGWFCTPTYLPRAEFWIVLPWQDCLEANAFGMFAVPASEDDLSLFADDARWGGATAESGGGCAPTTEPPLAILADRLERARAAGVVWYAFGDETIRRGV